MLGKLQAAFFPAVFGPNADQSLDADIVHEKFAVLAQEIAEATGNEVQPPEAVAEGFLRIAVENMANAIKKISVQRGYDVTEYTLNCFGGAAGQHACLVADALGMQTVFLHPFAGVLSAYGMGLADVRALRERQIEQPLENATLPVLDTACAELGDEASQEILTQGVNAGQLTLHKRVHLRYQGTDTALQVDLSALDNIQVAFEAAHKQRFGFIVEGRQLIAEAVSVEAVGTTEHVDDAELEVSTGRKRSTTASSRSGICRWLMAGHTSLSARATANRANVFSVQPLSVNPLRPQLLNQSGKLN